MVSSSLMVKVRTAELNVQRILLHDMPFFMPLHISLIRWLEKHAPKKRKQKENPSALRTVDVQNTMFVWFIANYEKLTWSLTFGLSADSPLGSQKSK